LPLLNVRIVADCRVLVNMSAEPLLTATSTAWNRRHKRKHEWKNDSRTRNCIY